MLARLGQPAEAWQRLEEDLGRGLLDELAARQDQRLKPGERDRLRELTAELERLDKLVETTPKDLDQAERAKRFEDLKRQRALASIALGEFQTKLVAGSRPAGGPGRHAERNPGRAARRCRAGRLGRHYTRGTECGRPRRRALGRGRPLAGHPGLDPDRRERSGGLWTEDDTGLAGQVRAELRRLPAVSLADLRPLVEKLRAQRLEPLAKALGASPDGEPTARRLIVLPSRPWRAFPSRRCSPRTIPGP